MKPVQIVTIGDVVADIVTEFPVFPIEVGAFIPARQLYLDAGGNANFLIVAARLGGKPIALGSIGEDFWGKQVIDILRDEGITTAYLTKGGSTTVAQVLVDKKGGHAFLGKYGSGPSLIFADKDHQVLKGSDALFCSGYSFADDRTRNYTLAALSAARQIGLPSYFDVGPASFELGQELISQILKQVDVVFLTEEELPALGTGSCEHILAAGPRVVVLKKGPQGCQVYLEGGPSFQAAGFPVEAVDTTAAGDSFAAGFITARCSDWDLEKCAVLANAVGAAKVKKMGGGRNVPDLDEIRAILQENQVDLLI